MKPKFVTDKFETNDSLTVFLYVLLRDYVPFGKLETIMQEQVENGMTGEGFLSEPTIARYACQLAARLRPDQPKKDGVA